MGMVERRAEMVIEQKGGEMYGQDSHSQTKLLEKFQNHVFDCV